MRKLLVLLSFFLLSSAVAVAQTIGSTKTEDFKAEFEKKYAQKKAGGKIKKAKSGGSFPDLNKDGKITKADILKGRGVIKNGAALKKQAAIAIAMKKAGKTPKKKMQYGGDAASMVPTMKKGGKMKMGGKCKNGC